MKTTKWGRDGWCCLELIVQNYPENPTSKHQRIYKSFFVHLGEMLPCIHCRRSYQVFIVELPIDDFLSNRDTLKYWLYLIHNKVNDKLRAQGYVTIPNPSFTEVYQKYKFHPKSPSCRWDFLYAIVFNYAVEPTSIDQYNYGLFFKQLGLVLPYHSYLKYYQFHPIDEFLDSREHLIQWFYNLQKHIYEVNHRKTPNYDKICERYENFRASSCHTKASNSCRK